MTVSSVPPAMTWEQAVLWLRAQPGQKALIEACFFDDPLMDAVERYHQSEEWQAVQRLLPVPHSGQTALDVGAGRGIASYALAKDGWQVTALEPDSSSLVGAQAIREVADQTGLPISVVEEWGEDLPFGDNSFDVVHARQVLHHARHLPNLCAELGRVLKPGGLLVATREHVLDSPDCLSAFLASHPLHSLYGGENAFTLEQYLDAMLKANLLPQQVLGTFDSAINHYPLPESKALELLLKNYPWRTQEDKGMLRHWGRRYCCANDYLYTFVAVSGRGSDETATLRSRLACVEARLDAQTRSLCRLSAATKHDSSKISSCSVLGRVKTRLRQWLGLFS